MSEPSPMLAVTDHFAALDDPRLERTKLHPLLSLITCALCAVICGSDSWDDIAEFTEVRFDWLASFLDLPNGPPSHDTFNRVFAALDPAQFHACFTAWMKAVATILPAEVIAVDGKTLRGSHDRFSDRAAIHMVSAWATANRLVLAQVKVDRKSNEITAIPELLRVLAINGCIVTIDAMGCQREIAQQIIDQGGDYVLALKENHDTLYHDVVDTFAQAPTLEDLVVEENRGIEKGHGRIEVRRVQVIPDPDVLAWLQDQHHWPGLHAIGRIEEERRIGSSRTRENRYYLLSKTLSAQAFGAAVRSHWGIENRLHWVLDVTFHEDTSRIRDGYAAENFAVLRHLALNLLQHHPAKRRSLKGKRLKAAWDTDFLLQVLTAI
jgi:predicted transposase YbfD/YdcC